MRDLMSYTGCVVAFDGLYGRVMGPWSDGRIHVETMRAGAFYLDPAEVTVIEEYRGQTGLREQMQLARYENQRLLAFIVDLYHASPRAKRHIAYRVFLGLVEDVSDPPLWSAGLSLTGEITCGMDSTHFDSGRTALRWGDWLRRIASTAGISRHEAQWLADFTSRRSDLEAGSSNSREGSQ